MSQPSVTIAVLTNGDQAMLVSFDGWNGAPPPLVSLRATRAGIEVTWDAGGSRGMAPREAADALRSAREAFCGSSSAGRITEHGPLGIAWLPAEA